MKINKILGTAFALCIMTSASFAQDAKKQAEKQNEKKFEDSKLEKDADFVVEAADAGMYEVQVAALAKSNATSNKVKELASHMFTDHTKANEELKKVAAKKNITIPTKLSDKKQNKFDKLLKLKGEDFDKEYTDMMVDDHEDDIKLFEKEAEKGNDGELKAWAAGKLPTLKHHLQMAKDTRDALKNSGGAVKNK
ncbi:MAG TPA: DUF4142 domain-containing protein [Bacteroidia bacterium]|jgi:putative membrane protein